MSGNKGEFEDQSAPERDRNRVLLEISDAVGRAKSVPDAFTQLANPVLDVTGADLLNLALHDPRRNSMRTHYWKKNAESGEFEALPVDGAASGWAWKHQEPLTIPDTEREQRFPGCVPVLRNHGVRSYTVLPLSTPSSHFGAIGLGKNVPEALESRDVELLSRVAEMGALALEKDRALEQQQSLVAISRQLSSCLDLHTLLPAILLSLRSIDRFEWSVLSLLDEEGKTVTQYGDALEWESSVSHGTTTLVGQSLSAHAIDKRSAVFFKADDLRSMESPLARSMFALGTRSVCSVPLMAGDRVWGTLDVSALGAAFGATDGEYLEQVSNQIATALRNAHSFRQIKQLKDRLAQKDTVWSEVRSASRSDDVIGSSAALNRVLQHAAIVAGTDSTVLITGETGTGKERIARVIHDLSARRDRNFIKLNCAAIPTGLLESELFGHEKGAFTGAVSQKIGRLELADKGTLLLDEVGEIPLELQPKLLRVLQDQEFERLGGTKTIRVDVRLIAATNRNLDQAVEDKEFRSDLFYRLHVFPLHLPPLRERREDIPLLIRHFVERCAARMNKQIEIIPDEAVETMLNWGWPGNIRELENFIERSVILSEGNRLQPPLAELRPQTPRRAGDVPPTLRERERDHIVEILRLSRGVLSGPGGAAARLGLKRTTLQYKMQKLGISRRDYLD